MPAHWAEEKQAKILGLPGPVQLTVSVRQEVPLLTQGPLAPTVFNSCSSQCPYLKMGVSLIPKGTLQIQLRMVPTVPTVQVTVTLTMNNYEGVVAMMLKISAT